MVGIRKRRQSQTGFKANDAHLSYTGVITHFTIGMIDAICAQMGNDFHSFRAKKTVFKNKTPPFKGKNGVQFICEFQCRERTIGRCPIKLGTRNP